MKYITAIFCLLFVHLSVNGQMADSVKSAIITVLLEKEVADKVFYNYQSEWKGETELPSGNYAFIYADTTFQKVYKGILTELRSSLVTDGYLYKRKFYTDLDRAIYIGGNLFTELVIVFKRIEFTADAGLISFYTSSRVRQKRFVDRYVEVTGTS